ncbi:MAG: tRNA uridine-5-carboxymethylaminomethyl(34) synthesis GTPase MnmE [Candidatus Omnitrophica bacterium]|nr:tRNA uridine-5-carboxymethylaminomethyl(34) synthesis GTPase MnmE [Candidatus Omnitrophota bacterium]
MNQYQSPLDTIAAIATATGAGGVAIVRVSGPESLTTAGKVFLARSAGALAGWRANVMHYGWVKDGNGVVVDEALAVVMRAPHSYTAEDTVEIHTHGGPAVVRLTLDRCLANGARLAEPGEFTRRAFLNGRIDLAQAEAVLDMVSARTELMLRAANQQLSGDLSRELCAMREVLMAAYAGIEALLNFPEDDTDRGQWTQVRGELGQAQARIAALLGTARAGVILREGVRLVICGQPNVGKSSLLNALLKQARAIVTDVAGTTRDILEESYNLQGVPVRLVDTAGLLAPRDKVEAEAVQRSYGSIAAADIVLVVLDRSAPLTTIEGALLHGPGLDPANNSALLSRMLVVLNKCDLPAAFTLADAQALVPGRAVVEVSALERHGIERLETALLAMVLKGGALDTNGVMLTNVRHVQALSQAAQALSSAIEALDTQAPAEMVSEGIKTAVSRLDAITGRNIDQDALDHIFASFCIGK